MTGRLATMMAFLIAPVAAHAQSAGDWSGLSFGAQFGYLDADTHGPVVTGGDGLTGGLRIHYDIDYGNYIVGAGLEWGSADVDLGDDGASIDSILRIKARAGYDAGPNWFYGTIGWSEATVDDPSNAIGESDGYFFGLGYEVYLTESLTAGAELLRHEFEDFDLRGLEVGATTLNVSVNFRF